MELPAGASGAPMTYMVDGKQYIVVAVSGRQYPGELIALGAAALSAQASGQA